MKRTLQVFLLVTLLSNATTRSFAWGAKGHALVAEIAFHFLDDSTKMVVQKYLGSLTIQEAANWMDENKSNSYYDFMRSWHYFDIEKGEPIVVTPDQNMLTVIFNSLLDLEKKDQMKKKEISKDLKLLFHLIGDLHQPLHCGYASDKGGNAIMIHSPFVSGNLHSVWDTQIIDYAPVNFSDCIKLYDSLSKQEIKAIRRLDVLGWYKESRSYLDTAYDFKNGLLDKTYLDNMTPIITKQLLRGGLRLASVLNHIFNPEKKQTVFNFGYDDYFNHYNYVAAPKAESMMPYPFIMEHQDDDCF